MRGLHAIGGVKLQGHRTPKFSGAAGVFVAGLKLPIVFYFTSHLLCFHVVCTTGAGRMDPVVLCLYTVRRTARL